MGKRNANRRNAIAAAMIDSDDDINSISSTSSVRSDRVSVGSGTDVDKDALLDQSLDDLYEKRSSIREKALERIIDALSSSLQHEFVEKNFETLLHQCLNSIKKGSSKEISLASHAIGLLALTTASGKNACEIVEESVPIITKSLSSSSESSKVVSLLECLAVITFVGWENPEVTEQAMQIMWQVVLPNSGTNVVAHKPTPAVIIAMISAWSFLLTAVNGWCLSLQDWQESISYLSTLLDMDDRGVRIAAGEALAIIHEVGDFDRFSNEDGCSNGSSGPYLLLEGLSYQVLNQARALASEAGGKGTSKKDLNNQRKFFRDVVDYLEHGYFPETSVKIGGGSIITSSWTQLIRLNFLRRFLRGGFVKHMMENDFLHDVFEFTPKKINLDFENHSAIKHNEKKLHKLQNAAAAKTRTKDMNKERRMIKDKIGHFAVAYGEE